MDFFQAYIDQMNEKLQKQRSQEQMTLGKLISKLEEMNPEDRIICSTDTSMKFTGFDSYRGYYNDLAISYETNGNGAFDTVKDFLSAAKECLGKTFYGYKGGEFVMHENTPLWIANYGHTSDFIIDRLEESDNCCFVYLAIKED